MLAASIREALLDQQLRKALGTGWNGGAQAQAANQSENEGRRGEAAAIKRVSICHQNLPLWFVKMGNRWGIGRFTCAGRKWTQNHLVGFSAAIVHPARFETL